MLYRHYEEWLESGWSGSWTATGPLRAGWLGSQRSNKAQNHTVILGIYYENCRPEVMCFFSSWVLSLKWFSKMYHPNNIIRENALFYSAYTLISLGVKCHSSTELFLVSSYWLVPSSVFHITALITVHPDHPPPALKRSSFRARGWTCRYPQHPAQGLTHSCVE